MKNIENKVKRICDLYVNDWHLTTTLLPYINTQISKNTEIITILENGIIDNVKELLSKMNLNKATQDKILQIDWTSTIYKHSKIKNIIEDLMENNEALKSISNLTNISRKDLVSMLKELKNDENLTVDIKELKINIYTEGLANNFKGIKFIIDKNEIFSYLNHDTNSVLNIRGESLDLKLNFDNNKSNVILNYEDIPIFNAEFTKDNDKTNVEFEINIEVNDETLEVSGTAQYELKRIGDKRQTFKLSGNINTNINKEKSSFKIELNNMTQVGGKVQDIDVSNAINVEDFTLKDIKIIDSSMERVLYKSPLLDLYKAMFGDKVQNIYDCAKSYGCICNDVECRCKYLDDYKVEKDIICPI